MIRTSGPRELAEYLGYGEDGGVTATDRRHVRHILNHGPHAKKVSQRLCEEIRRRRHNGESGSTVYDGLPVEISRSTMDRHARGDCPHPSDVPPVDADGQITQVQCAMLRMACWDGVTQSDAATLPADTVDQTTVWHHVSGRCAHLCGVPSIRQETVTPPQCQHWTDRRNRGEPLPEVASSTAFTESTISKHTRGACEHDTGVFDGAD